MTLLLHAQPAAAQNDTERARQLFEQGVAAMERGAPSEAAGYFDQSYQLFPRASTACNMAVAQRDLGRHCDAQRWYQQCASLDESGRFRENAEREAAALNDRCQPAHDPFVNNTPPEEPQQPEPQEPQAVQEPEPAAQPSYSAPYPTRPYPVRDPVAERRRADHTLLGWGIAGLSVGGAALIGGIFSAQAATDEAALIIDSDGDGILQPGTPDADHYQRAASFNDLAVALYVGAGLLGLLGAIFIIIDVAQPGASDATAAQNGLHLAIRPGAHGGLAEAALVF